VKSFPLAIRSLCIITVHSPSVSEIDFQTFPVSFCRGFSRWEVSGDVLELGRVFIVPIDKGYLNEFIQTEHEIQDHGRKSEHLPIDFSILESIIGTNGCPRKESLPSPKNSRKGRQASSSGVCFVFDLETKLCVIAAMFFFKVTIFTRLKDNMAATWVS